MLRRAPLCRHFGVLVEARRGETLDALDRSEVIACIREHGVILFASFNADAETFTRFTDQFTRDFSGYEGGASSYGLLSRDKIGNNDTLLSTSGSKLGFSIPLHGEMYYWNLAPELLWFFCEQPPARKQGGQTTLCDGVRAYDSLGNEVRSFFEKNRLKYIRTFAPGEWQHCFQTESLDDVRSFCEARGGTFEPKPDGSVRSEFVTSAFRTAPDGKRRVWINNVLVFIKGEQSHRKIHGGEKPSPLAVRLEDDSPIPDSILKAVVDATEPITYEVQWRKGDLVMIDNRSILHGRRKAEPESGRAIYMRMGQAAFD
jgi:alpha-ketoglutarate-dependent taurine dioxygenase